MIRLEPLELRHAEGLFNAASPEVFRFLKHSPVEWSREGFAQYIERLKREGSPFAVVFDDEVVGTVSMIPTCDHQTIEVAGIWYGIKWQGTDVHPAVMLQVLAEIFEDKKAKTAEFFVDELNLQSIRSLEKIGAKRDDSVTIPGCGVGGAGQEAYRFTLSQGDWPSTKAKLKQRIAQSG